MRVDVREQPRFPMAIPAGEFLLAASLDDRLRLTSGAAVRTGDAAHPALAFVLALGGAGEDIATTLKRGGYAIDQAPLLAGCEIAFQERLTVDTLYRVDGELAGVTRKPSRRFGTADHLHFHYRFAVAGRPVGTLSLTMVIGVQIDE